MHNVYYSLYCHNMVSGYHANDGECILMEPPGQIMLLYNKQPISYIMKCHIFMCIHIFIFDEVILYHIISFSNLCFSEDDGVPSDSDEDSCENEDGDKQVFIVVTQEATVSKSGPDAQA